MIKAHLSERRIVQYLNGSFSEKDSKAIEAHLQLCEKCRRTTAIYAKINNVLDYMPTISPSDSFTDQVMNAISIESVNDPANRRQVLAPARGSHRSPWTEFANTIVACAATYLFIVSGTLHDIVTIAASQLGYGVGEMVVGISAKVVEWFM